MTHCDDEEEQRTSPRTEAVARVPAGARGLQPGCVGGSSDKVTIEVETDRGALLPLDRVEDNGRGMGPPREGGLGLRLIDAFTTQLDGQVEREPVAKGTRTCVQFPLPL